MLEPKLSFNGGGVGDMESELSKLLSAAQSRTQTQIQRERQRLGFAFGNGLEEGQKVTKQSIRETDKRIRSQLGPKVR